MDKYIWWRVSDLLPFFIMLAKAVWSVGFSNVRIEVHQKDKGAELKVATDADGKREVCGEYDDAHECPIDCS